MIYVKRSAARGQSEIKGEDIWCFVALWKSDGVYPWEVIQ